MITQFELGIPANLASALELLGGSRQHKLALLAGGTNLIVDIRAGRERPGRVVSLAKVSGLSGIECNGQRVSIGSGTTVTELLHSTVIATQAPSLFQAAGVFAGQMVRNTATVGGNIGCGSPAADLVPPLMSLAAEVELTKSDGTRTIALEDYFQGYKKDQRRANELISRISWPCLPDNAVNTFYKLARRKGDAITITGVAVTLLAAAGRCLEARIALGAVSPTVIRARTAEAWLEGGILEDQRLDEAAELAAGACHPIDDVRASAHYRRLTVASVTRRLLIEARDRLQ